MFILTELLNVLHGFRKRQKILCCDHIFDHCESRTGVRRKMSILNYFKKKETPLCLERIDKSNETSASLQLTSTELMECVVTELKSVKSKGE